MPVSSPHFRRTHTRLWGVVTGSVQFAAVVQSLSRARLVATPWTAACQASLFFTVSWSLLKLMSPWCHPTISSSVVTFSSCLQSFPASGSFPMSQFFASGGLSIRVSASVFPLFRVDFLSNWLVWSCCPRDSQDSYSATQFESISSSTLSLLYGPTLISIYDYWKCVHLHNIYFSIFYIPIFQNEMESCKVSENSTNNYWRTIYVYI